MHLISTHRFRFRFRLRLRFGGGGGDRAIAIIVLCIDRYAPYHRPLSSDDRLLSVYVLFIDNVIINQQIGRLLSMYYILIEGFIIGRSIALNVLHIDK